jgi:sulfur-oxidizing protein SoxY
MSATRRTTRREVLAGGLLLLCVRPAAATPDAMAAAIRAFTGGRAVTDGGVTLDVPPLVENGNSVPLTVAVESPMTARDFVRTIAIFNEKNPQPDVARFHLGPRAGRAVVSTRIRLADSQRLTAIAEMSDGTLRQARADVIVTLAACLEG